MLPSRYRNEERAIDSYLHSGLDDSEQSDNLRGNFAGSLVLHGLVAAAIFGSAYLYRSHHPNWGEHASNPGAIQATMVSSLPLPPTQRTLDEGVLTSDSPSAAPVIAKEETQPPPDPKEIAIPKEITKPIKTAEKPTPAPPKRLQPVPPQPMKATTGETAGVRIAQSTLQVKNGTASVSVEDRTFGDRFAYYVNIVNTKVAQNWLTAEADPRASVGKSTTIVFDIDRAGVPSNVRVETASGSPTLDLSAMRAVQRVDGFGPLPQGNRITVEYTFHLHPQ